jgi:anthranilate synthase component 1
LNAYPDLEGFVAASADATVVPVCMERIGDLLTPVSAALRLAGHVRRPFLLESAEGGEHIGRYSYLGGDPFLELVGDADGLVLRPAGEPEQRLEGDPVTNLAEIQARYRGAEVAGAPPFSGGGVGYIGYDAVRWVERIPYPRQGDDLPWLYMGFYDTLLAFDHLKHRIKLVANAHVKDPEDDGGLRRAYDDAVERLTRLARLLDAPAPECAPLDVVSPTDAPALPTTEEPSRERFCEGVERSRDYIRAGDVFQVVLSRRLECRTDASPLTVYRALRAINPSPYMFCLDTGAAAIVGSSPEMLVRVEDGVVENRPIAGTRRRDADPEIDRSLEEELLADEKERAEHLMLVDLGRNDIGRVAEYGAVEVPEFMRIERYSHVMHIVSSVRGALRADVSPTEALFASFPAGTVSGAPKIRAMEIINELEEQARGVYAGAVLYSDFAGNLNSCIAIRTIVMREGIARVQAGAGLVIDSRAERELVETDEKAAAPLQALAWAEAATAEQQRRSRAGPEAAS